MKKILILLLLISTVGFAQNLNEYKYAMVPVKFSFFKEPNLYGLNLLTKLYMEKYGFETYYDTDIFPADFANNNFNKIFINVIENNSLFTTKLSIVIKDYKNNILFISQEGKSNEKEYKVAYNLALREAFDNFSILKSHKYQQNTRIEENSIENSKLDVGETTSEISNSNLSVVKTENGFDLYNVDKKIVLTAKNTSVKNIFIAIAGNERGILQKGKDDVWYFEYYREGSKKLISENLLFNL